MNCTHKPFVPILTPIQKYFTRTNSAIFLLLREIPSVLEGPNCYQGDSVEAGATEVPEMVMKRRVERKLRIREIYQNKHLKVLRRVKAYIRGSRLLRWL